MKNSKYVQLDPNALMEYIYDDSNLVSENYVVTLNRNNDLRSFSAQNTEGGTNKYENQYVTLDPVNNRTGIRDEEEYNFLQNKDYSQTLPIRYDKIRIYFPPSYNFADNAGCYIRIYVMDFNNQNTVNLVQYYFDKQDQERFNRELNISQTVNSLNGKDWGKYIEIQFPSPYILSQQRVNTIPTPSSINSNLTEGVGISTTSPIMVEFGFINQKTTINEVTTFLFSVPFETSVPLTPEFENLGLRIENSEDGDWFEIFGTVNSDINEFNQWINQSRNLGKNYYVEYEITLFEENIRGNSMTIRKETDFNEPIEYRPIIKFSTTTAIIDVLMKVVDRGSNAIITRRASYGMLSDELSKYSRSVVRIATGNQNIPKIYNLRNGGSIFDAFSGLNKRNFNSGLNDLFNDGLTGNTEVIRVPYPVIVNVNNIVAKSDSELLNGQEWRGFGKLKLVIDPFDNILKFNIARNIEDTVEYLNMLDLGEINLYFKNFDTEVRTNLYRQSDDIDLERGTVLFKLRKESVNKVRRIFQSGINMFYITSTNSDTNETNVVYEGTFIMSDSVQYVNDLAQDYQNENEGVEIRRDNNQETAIVTRRRTEGQDNNSNNI